MVRGITTLSYSNHMNTALAQQSEHVAERLAAITGVIQELYADDPAMLVLFGSYARGLGERSLRRRQRGFQCSERFRFARRDGAHSSSSRVAVT